MTKMEQIGSIEFIVPDEVLNTIKDKDCSKCWWNESNCSGVISFLLGAGAVLYVDGSSDGKLDIDQLEQMVSENRPICFGRAERGNMKVRDRKQGLSNWYWPDQFEQSK